MGKFLHSFFSPLGFRRAVPQVWDGFQTNIKLMVIAEILVLFFALGLAIVRGLPGRATLPLRMLAIAYTDFFRGTPLILVAYVWGLGIPALHVAVPGDLVQAAPDRPAAGEAVDRFRPLHERLQVASQRPPVLERQQWSPQEGVQGRCDVHGR